jgi:hypothetical protein
VPGSLQDDRAAFVLDAGERPAVHILGQLLVGMGMSAIGTSATWQGTRTKAAFGPGADILALVRVEPVYWFTAQFKAGFANAPHQNAGAQNGKKGAGVAILGKRRLAR